MPAHLTATYAEKLFDASHSPEADAVLQARWDSAGGAGNRDGRMPRVPFFAYFCGRGQSLRRTPAAGLDEVPAGLDAMDDDLLGCVCWTRRRSTIGQCPSRGTWLS